MKLLLRASLIAASFAAAPLTSANAQATQTVFSFSSQGFSTSLTLNTSSTFAAVARGWYDETGSSNGNSNGSNYIAGRCGPVACGGSGSMYRNWFSFNLANFTPLVTSAVLQLQNPNVGFFNELGSSLDYSLFQVSTGFAQLGLGNSLATFTDLGDGSLFGSVNVTSADNGTTIEIALNAAGLASINNAREQGQWAVGGAIDASTNVVPEPSTYALMATGLAGIVALARTRKRVS